MCVCVCVCARARARARLFTPIIFEPVFMCTLCVNSFTFSSRQSILMSMYIMCVLLCSLVALGRSVAASEISL